VRINAFRGVHYKSFADTEEIRLEPGFNVIVGRNNAGKTALAEVLSLRFSAKPHRSSKAMTRLNAQPDPESRAEV
jgi:recombinational DNA repair ATPase RecF